MATNLLTRKLSPTTNRDPKCADTDISAVRAIAQAAINVELFTIPLYMVALYSIQGTHPINTKGIKYYQGRVWPGSATTANPQDEDAKNNNKNATAFNIVFSVFIQEMLHLQMASNIAKAIGVQPCFNSSLLQNIHNYAWICYGDNTTVIPHIIDLKDTTQESYKDVKVKLDSLNQEQLKLFLAIEQSEEDARKNICDEQEYKYFPQVPFQNWTPEKTEKDLPMFGSIGWLYECYACYLNIKYSDGKTLWDKIHDGNVPLQKDMFNYTNPKSHPKKEFLGFEPSLENNPGNPLHDVIDMMSAITDQGEGSTIQTSTITPISWWKNNEFPALEKVQDKYRPSKEALKTDYPAYTDTGEPAESRDAVARYCNSEPDHYERFQAVEKLLNDNHILTWDTWHNQGNSWTAEDLTAPGYHPNTVSQGIPIPKPQEVADALNNLKRDDTGNNYDLVSQAGVGAIAGITTVLNDYWENPKQQFPYPSMVGSGDRVSICWAIFGKAPDLSRGIGKQEDCKLYHACQGLNIDEPGDPSEASVEVFHSCRGSNACKAQGGCGYVQLDKGGGSCSSYRVAEPEVVQGEGALCGSKLFSAPADNRCRGFGGCAVPISASQLFPRGGEMKLYDFVDPNHSPHEIGSIHFYKGENVYDKAWEAYSEVVKERGHNPGEKPKPSDLRLAFPPST